jgi:hypothetical protein
MKVSPTIVFSISSVLGFVGSTIKPPTIPFLISSSVSFA